MAKLLKHFGWGVKKSSHQMSSGRSDCNNSTQKSNSVHELMPKSPSRYQSNVSLTSGNVVAIGSTGGSSSGTPVTTCSISSTRSEYDTRSLKLNLDGSKHQNQNERHQYQSLKKGIGCSSSSKASKSKCEGFGSPVGSIESPEGTSSSDSAIMPTIADEYCDPLDLAETSSLLIDDDYSIPYDEVNKVLKDIQTNKAERLLNGINSNIISTDGLNSVDGEELAKVPLKLTSSSQVTSLRIKPRRPKERKEAADKSEEGKIEPRNQEDESMDCTINKVSSSNGISALVQNSISNVPLSSASHVSSFETIDGLAENNTTGKHGGHLYSSNSTSGGSVTVVSTNNFNDFVPIDCGHMISSLSISQSKEALALNSTSEVKSKDEMTDSADLPMKSDQFCQTSKVKCEPHSEMKADNSPEKNLIRPHNSNRTRPKSDGILFSPKGSKKLRHKQIQNGLKNDVKVIKNPKCSDCHHDDHGNCSHVTGNYCSHGNKTLHKESRNKDNESCSPLKSKIRLNPPLQQQSWFRGQMGRIDAEKLLEGRPEGTFLVRICESNSEDFSLSLKSSTGFLHIKIVKQVIDEKAGKFILGQFSQPFESVASMVQFYQENKLPVKGSESLFLTNPLAVVAS